MFLHELGSVQYFTNEFLRDRVIINPQWLVDVMACIVTVKESVIQVSTNTVFFVINWPVENIFKKRTAVDLK